MSDEEPQAFYKARKPINHADALLAGVPAATVARLRVYDAQTLANQLRALGGNPTVLNEYEMDGATQKAFLIRAIAQKGG